MSKFVDPCSEEMKILCERLRELKTVKEVQDLVTEIYPEWIIGFIDEYSLDYPHLTRNWARMVAEVKAPKMAQIMLVSELVTDDPKYTFLNIIAGIMTESGFVVRSISDIVPCSLCGKGIPTQRAYNIMKEHNVSGLPESYSRHCSIHNK